MTRPTKRFLPVDARTGSWSKPLSRIVSMASMQGVLVETVVTGFRRRVRMVASPNGDLSFEVDVEERRT